MKSSPPVKDTQAQAPERRLSRTEFTVMLALLMATVAYSIDAMLPAFPQIAATFALDDPNRAQLVLTAFMLGLGAGTFFVGPLSDAFGRKRVILAGTAVYLVGAMLAAQAQSLEALLVARVVQGLGASAARIVSMALVRDLYAGREMARVTSFIMMLFILVPAVAPSIGALVISFAGWRGVFWSFAVFGLIGAGWLMIRQPETLPPERRRPLHLATLWSAIKEILSHRDVRIYVVVLSLGFGQMFAMISSSQQLFAAHGVTDTFALWFAAMALVAGTGTIFNAKFVMSLGMRKIASGSYLMQIIASGFMGILAFSGLSEGPEGFIFVWAWAVSVFFMAGVTFGNINALAMEKMGHIAGIAASVITAISTLCAVLIAGPVGLMFDGTARPLVAATFLCSGSAWLLMKRVAP
ncbi:multidrug effflux MFS transporter [Thioclava sp. A2]|uniref:multidrug effflux MFS transporter n=1 Tax=Thioclava sp. FCG-A2 TaxID=3080562 RepID=UPI002954D85A|nr:multidrug effflux MFS transporter [Thioclava sp. A2]